MTSSDERESSSSGEDDELEPVAEDVQPVKVTAEQLGIKSGASEEEGVEYDVGHLCAFDPRPLDPSWSTGDVATCCLDAATRLTQGLLERLFTLPSEATKGGRIVELPAPTTHLPREKPLPQPRALTKWEKFAQQKGIVKRKRSKLAWDETRGEWRRRYGYKRADDLKDIAVIEAKPGDKVGEDPFTAMEREKKERVKAQSKRQLGNVKQALKDGAALPATLKLAASLPIVGKGKPEKRKELHEDVKLASRQAGISTASMGKFDRRLKGEKEGERQPLGKRRKFLSATDTAAEKSKLATLTDKFLRERADDIVDVKKAVGKMEAERREQRHQAKLRDAEDDDGDRKKGGKKGFNKTKSFGKSKGGKAGGLSGGKGGSGAKGGRGGSKGKPGVGSKGVGARKSAGLNRTRQGGVGKRGTRGGNRK